MPAGNRLIVAGLAALLAGTAPAPIAAQAVDSDIHAGTLNVPLDKSQVITADRPIAKAMIGNAEIADILPLTDRSIYVLGKAMGTTSLTLYDSSGRVLTVMDIAVGPDVEAFSIQAAQLIPGETIHADISGNSIVLTGMVSDPGAVDRAIRLARTYAGDNVVNMMTVGSSQQVMLEVTFAEVRRSVGEEIGFSGFLSNGSGSFTATMGGGAAGQSGSFSIFTGNFNIGGLGVDAVLGAMEAKGYAKILAEPTLVALSGESASFLAGGEFPVPMSQGSLAGGTQAISVQFKPFGVSLKFTPTVLSDRTINLRVEPEVSSIDTAASLTLNVNGISVPGVQTRRASTVLELRDGESFAIAGLLQEDFATTIEQVPLLGSLPIIGTLFRSTEFRKGETELLIVVTPHLVSPIKQDQVRLPTDRVADPTAAEAILYGESYDPVPMSAPARPADKSGDDYEW